MSAVLVSRFSTQLPERRGLCEVRFGWRERGDDAGTPYALTTEGQVWEWMYGDGAEAPGTTTLSKISQELSDSPLRQQFQHAATNQRCVFCDARLRVENDEVKCENGHIFGKYSALQPPEISVTDDR